MTTVHRWGRERRRRRLRIECGLVGRLIWRLKGRIGLVGRASRPIGPGVLPVALAVILVRVLARVLPLIPASVLGAVVVLPGIWRLGRLGRLRRVRRLRALIIRLVSPIGLPSMVRRHLVRPSLSSSAMLPGSSRPNPRPHRLIHNITLLGIDWVLIAQTVPPSWCASGILSDSQPTPEYYNDGAANRSPLPGSSAPALSPLSASRRRMASLHCVAFAPSHTWRVCRSSLLHPIPTVYENDASGADDTPDIVSSGHNFTTDSTAHWAEFVIHGGPCVLSPSCLRQGASLTMDTRRQQDPVVAEKAAYRYARVF